MYNTLVFINAYFIVTCIHQAIYPFKDNIILYNIIFNNKYI